MKNQFGNLGAHWGHAKPTSLRRLTARMDFEGFLHYFNTMRTREEEFPILLSEPGRKFACDEHTMNSGGDKLKAADKYLVFPKRFYGKRVRTAALNDGTGHVSLLSCGSCDGPIPNAYLATGKCPQLRWSDGPYPSPLTEAIINGLSIYALPKGTSTKESFLLWLKEHFIVHARKRFPDGPIVLCLDKAVAHTVIQDFEVVTWCYQNELYFDDIPAGAGDKLDPFDLIIFGIQKKNTNQLFSAIAQVHGSNTLLELKLSHMEIVAVKSIKWALSKEERALGFEDSLSIRTRIIGGELCWQRSIVNDKNAWINAFDKSGITSPEHRRSLMRE